MSQILKLLHEEQQKKVAGIYEMDPLNMRQGVAEVYNIFYNIQNLFTMPTRARITPMAI